MAGVFDLANVFKLVDDGFDQGSTLQNSGIERGMGARFHVAPSLGDELHAPVFAQLCEPLSAMTVDRELVATIDWSGAGLSGVRFIRFVEEASSHQQRQDLGLAL